MKTITLKADEELDATVSRIAEERKRTRSAVIREAIFCYEEQLRRAKLKAEIRAASLIVRGESLQTATETREANADGL